MWHVLKLACAFVQFAAMVKKYKPVAYVNGHDHVIDHSAAPGYATQFYTSGVPFFQLILQTRLGNSLWPGGM